MVTSFKGLVVLLKSKAKSPFLLPKTSENTT